MTKFRIQLVESERGWGREYWSEDFASYEEAVARIKEVNSANTSLVAPDYYVQADNHVEEVEA